MQPPDSNSLDPTQPVEDAYAELSHHLRVLAMRLVREESTADDVVQEAWLAALDAPPDHVRNLNGWLRQVVSNVARRKRRTRARRSEVEALATQDEPREHQSNLSSFEVAELLRNSVASQREPYRTVLTLRFFDELTAQEIAAQLGSNPATVRSQIKRGLAALRETLDQSHDGRRDAWVLLLMPVLPGGISGNVRGDVPGNSSGEKLASRSAVNPSPSGSAPIRGTRWGRWGILAVATGAAVFLIARPGDEGQETGPVLPFEPAVAAKEPVPIVEEEGARVALSASERAAPIAAEPPEGTYQLIVNLERSDGTPAIGGLLSVRGKDVAQIANPDHALGLWEADLQGRVELSVDQEQLDRSASRPMDGPGLFLEGRDRDEAWSSLYEASFPEGRRREITIHTRGPAQDISVRVLDESGQPLAGAFLLFRGQYTGGHGTRDGSALIDSEQLYPTDSRGEVLLRWTPRRDHRFVVRARGKAPLECVLSSDGPLAEDTVTVPDGQSVYGRVFLPDDTPARDAQVWLEDIEPELYARRLNSARADSDGYFELTGLALGTHVLFARSTRQPELFASTRLTVGAEEEAVWEPTLSKRRPLEVTVVHQDGKPAAEGIAVVQSIEPPFWTTGSDLDEQGRAVFTELSPGPLDILGSDSHRFTTRGVATNVQPGAGAIHITLEEPVATCSVFAVIATARGDRVERARLVAKNDHGGAFDAMSEALTGVVNLANLRPDRYQLLVRVDGSGQWNLGERDLSDGRDLDLGEVFLPALQRVEIDWGQRQPSEERPWQIVSRPVRTNDHVRALVKPLDFIELFPGNYVLRPYGDLEGGVAFSVGLDRPGRVVFDGD